MWQPCRPSSMNVTLMSLRSGLAWRAAGVPPAQDDPLPGRLTEALRLVDKLAR